MKRLVVVGSLCVFVSLLLIPLSAAVEPVESSAAVLDAMMLDVLPVQVQGQVRAALSQDPALAQAIVRQMPSALVQAASYVQARNGSNRTILHWVWLKVMNYRILRLLVSLIIYEKYRHTARMEYRVLTWAIKVMKWARIGVLLGFVTPLPLTPHITFVADLVARTITVNATDSGVPWSYIGQVGNGTCSAFPSGNVTVGQVIMNCSGEIMLVYIPRGEVLFNATFPE